VIWQLLHDDAALLGRRLFTCGAHAAAKQLCLIRDVPAQYVVEVTDLHPYLLTED
jgi:hypothetical protein